MTVPTVLRKFPLLFVMVAVILTSGLSASPRERPGNNSPHPLVRKCADLYERLDFEKTILACLNALKDPGVHRNMEDVIRLKNLLGASYTELRSFDRAIATLQEALDLAAQHLHPKHPLAADAHYHLGVCYDRARQPALALSHHHTALEIRINEFGDGHPEVAESYNGLGELYLYTMLDNRNANRFFRQCVAILEKKLRPDDYSLYVAYFNLANSARRMGDMETALTYAFKSLSVIESKNEYRTRRERCYTMLGNIYYSRTDYDEAIEYMTRGIDESIQNQGPGNYELVVKYLNLGVVHMEKGNLEEAIRYYRQSFRINRQQTHPDPVLEGDIYSQTGVAFQKSWNPDSAMSNFRKCYAVRVSVNGPKHPTTSRTLRYMANLYRTLKIPDSAALYIQRSLIAAIPEFNDANIYTNPRIGPNESQEELFTTLADKGVILKEQYLSNPRDLRSLQTARDCFRISDRLMEYSRSNYRGDDSKLFLAAHYRNIYEEALEVSHLLFEKTKDEQYFADAVMFMEKNKAFLLAESLQRAEMFNAAGIPDSVRDVERKLSGELAHHRARLEEHRLENGSEEEIQQIQGDIFQLTKKKESLANTLAQQYPNYFFAKYPSLATLAQIRAYAAQHNAVVVEYFWGANRVYVASITGKRANLRVIDNPAGFRDVLSVYYQELQPGGAGTEAGRFQAYFSSAHALYQGLLAPALDGNDDFEKVIIVRDGPLLLIPFESLPVSDRDALRNDYRALDYVLEHYSISYAHSASLLVRNAERMKPSSSSTVLAFSYSSEGPVQAHTGGDGALAELPGTAQELKAIARFFHGAFFRGASATEKNFKTQAGRYDILHLAIHGRADPEKQFSGTLLFKDSTGSAEDGELQLHELYDLSLNARLAVLSACESGVGKVYNGEGVFSISRGFDYAGCPSTVITLWKVSDVTSARIMEDFYRELHAGADIDVSLRSAKLAYLKRVHPRLAHPSYWAAFIPTGNTEPVTAAGNQALILRVAVLSLFVLAALLWWRKVRKGRKVSV